MTLTRKFSFLSALIFAFSNNCNANKNPYMNDGRKAIVHLFEWRWDDIADECERFLGPMGFGGVQTSPANEHAILAPAPFDNKVWRPWYERYQPVSYKLVTRSGNEEQFRDMVERCNNVGVRIYVDIIINHMTGGLGQGNGTAGSYFDSEKLEFSGVPYSHFDFNSCDKCGSSSCNIENFADGHQVRNCRLVGLKDLDQSKEYVRGKLSEFLNHLIDIGVAGFRVDAAKHVYPYELAQIYDQLHNLNATWFPEGAKPFIFQEVIDFGGESISAGDYTTIGRVTEFKYGRNLGKVFLRQDGLKWLQNFGEGWAMMKSEDALVFIDNHDNQRGHHDGILTHKNSRLYKMASAFMLAWPYGVPRVMSSIAFDSHEDWKGPPSDSNFNILNVQINPDLTCSNGWVCEHRWRQIYNMIRFGKTAGNAGVNDWWSAHTHQIAFSRADRAFIAINNEDFHLTATIQTGMPPGEYCDIISGNKVDGSCTGRIVKVKDDRKVDLNIDNTWDDPMIAIHVDSKIL